VIERSRCNDILSVVVDVRRVFKSRVQHSVMAGQCKGHGAVIAFSLSLFATIVVVEILVNLSLKGCAIVITTLNVLVLLRLRGGLYRTSAGSLLVTPYRGIIAKWVQQGQGREVIIHT
jgi:hypothetical protein